MWWFSKHTSHPTPQPTTLGISIRGGDTHAGLPDAVSTITPDGFPSVLGVNVGGRITYVLPANVPQPNYGLNLHVACPGYASLDTRINVVDKPDKSWDFDLEPAGAIVVAGPHTFSNRQLRAWQGDAMKFVPALKPNFTDDNGNYDPVLRIRRVGDGGQVARGIEAGQVWWPTIWRYSREQRQIFYAKVLADKDTHGIVQVAQPGGPDGGYHGIYPITQDECDTYGARQMEVIDECEQLGIVPVWAGVAPVNSPGGAPLARGMDASRCRVAMPDWDNNRGLAGRVKACHDTFPNALIYVERPGPMGPDGPAEPEACSDDPIPPTPTNGGAWLRAMQQRYPRFVGVLYEVNQGDGLDACAAELTKCHAWFRDIDEVMFEISHYETFWGNRSADEKRVFNDALAGRCPWFVGCFSGWTNKPAPPDEVTGPPIVSAGTGDQIPAGDVTIVDGPNVLDFAITTTITKLEVNTTGFHVECGKLVGDGRWPDLIPPGWTGPLQYSMGLAIEVDGHWYAAAPIEVWYGLLEAGGPVLSQAVEGTPHGQIAKNWFEGPRWGRLNGQNPRPGDRVGFFICAGDARNHYFGAPDAEVYERSNIVAFTWPEEGHSTTFTYTGEKTP